MGACAKPARRAHQEGVCCLAGDWNHIGRHLRRSFVPLWSAQFSAVGCWRSQTGTCEFGVEARLVGCWAALSDRRILQYLRGVIVDVWLTRSVGDREPQLNRSSKRTAANALSVTVTSPSPSHFPVDRTNHQGRLSRQCIQIIASTLFPGIKLLN